ncbi:chalcone isomerase family protein [Pleionea sediminis]|uniref:chalcone isomerase family protein n=1 Tax=Pleionea sediminis TaxID=2569479 RepID=UPI001186B230|nr:chalcone isomerase family protein [Pleionea sediminis]
MFKKLLILIFSIGYAHLTWAKQSDLQALARFEKLSTPIYYAAIYMDTKANSTPELLDNTKARMMEYRFIDDILSSRTFSRIFLERIVANNDREFLSHHIADIRQLVELIRQEYKKGDRIQVVYEPSKPVIIMINNAVVAEFQQQGFFNVLMNSWVGNTLNSETFIKQLIAEPNKDALKKFNRLELDSRRSRWAKSLPTLKPDTNEKQIAQSDTTEKPKPVKREVTKKTSSNTKKEQPKKKQVASKPVNKTVNKPVKKPVKKDPPKQIAKTTPQVKKQVTAKPKENKGSARTEAMNSLLRELQNEYLEELKDSIVKKANIRPPLKMRRIGREDLVASVSLNKNGDVRSVTLDDNPHGDRMAKVVIDELSNLSDLPKPPPLLEEARFTVSVTFNFGKCKRTPSAWLCF